MNLCGADAVEADALEDTEAVEVEGTAAVMWIIVSVEAGVLEGLMVEEEALVVLLVVVADVRESAGLDVGAALVGALSATTAGALLVVAG